MQVHQQQNSKSVEKILEFSNSMEEKNELVPKEPNLKNKKPEEMMNPKIKKQRLDTIENYIEEDE